MATHAQRAAARAGAGISELARRFGMPYGDAGRLIADVRRRARALIERRRIFFNRGP